MATTNEVLADVLIAWAVREDHDITRADRIAAVLRRATARRNRRWDAYRAACEASGNGNVTASLAYWCDLWGQACDLEDRLADAHREIAQRWPARFGWDGRRLVSDGQLDY